MQWHPVSPNGKVSRLRITLRRIVEEKVSFSEIPGENRNIFHRNEMREEDFNRRKIYKLSLAPINPVNIYWRDEVNWNYVNSDCLHR